MIGFLRFVFFIIGLVLTIVGFANELEAVKDIVYVVIGVILMLITAAPLAGDVLDGLD